MIENLVRFFLLFSSFPFSPALSSLLPAPTFPLAGIWISTARTPFSLRQISRTLQQSLSNPTINHLHPSSNSSMPSISPLLNLTFSFTYIPYPLNIANLQRAPISAIWRAQTCEVSNILTRSPNATRTIQYHVQPRSKSRLQRSKLHLFSIPHLTLSQKAISLTILPLSLRSPAFSRSVLERHLQTSQCPAETIFYSSASTVLQQQLDIVVASKLSCSMQSHPA